MKAWIFVAEKRGPWTMVGFSHVYPNEFYEDPRVMYTCYEAIECPAQEAEFFLVALKDEDHMGFSYRTLQEAQQTLERWKILAKAQPDRKGFFGKSYFLRYVKRGLPYVLPEMS